MSSTPYSLYSAPSLEGPTGPAGSTGAAGPTGPSSGGGQLIQSGTVNFTSNAQTVVFPKPFATTPQVFVTPTGNGAGVNGYMFPGVYSSLTQFLILYSAGTPDPQYGPIVVFWMAIGT